MAENKDQSTEMAVEDSTAISVNQTEPVERPSQQPDPREQLLREFVSIASKELEVRERELGIKGKEIDYAHEYSMKALDVQGKDLSDDRVQNKSTRRDYLIAGGGVLLLVFIFLFYCLYSDNKDIAIKIVEIGGTALISSVSGYFYGKSKGKEEESGEME